MRANELSLSEDSAEVRGTLRAAKRAIEGQGAGDAVPWFLEAPPDKEGR